LDRKEKYRYERKFRVESLGISEVENIINAHPAMFSEIFYEREVYNIYYDTSTFDNYYSNVDGNTKRTKVRIRWYNVILGEVLTPVLELKIKDGLLGTKKSYPLEKFMIKPNMDIGTIENIFCRSNIPAEIQEMVKGLSPTLVNTYIRKYFLSADNRYRITIDRQQQYFHSGHLAGFLSSGTTNNTSIILELKYDQSSDNDANIISAYFPFRMTKNSKYVSGIENLYRY